MLGNNVVMRLLTVYIILATCSKKSELGETRCAQSARRQSTACPLRRETNG